MKTTTEQEFSLWEDMKHVTMGDVAGGIVGAAVGYAVAFILLLLIGGKWG